jgi:hypothetical protein
MKRAGGYSLYWQAYGRLLVADSRPLDAVSANVLPPGRHTVTVVTAEWGWNWLRLELEGRARRRIWVQLWSREFSDIGMEGVKPGVAAARLRGKQLQVDVAAVGDADVRVAADGSLLVIHPAGDVEIFQDVAELDAALGERGLRRRQPTVVNFILPAPRGSDARRDSPNQPARSQRELGGDPKVEPVRNPPPRR